MAKSNNLVDTGTNDVLVTYNKNSEIFVNGRSGANSQERKMYILQVHKILYIISVG